MLKVHSSPESNGEPQERRLAERRKWPVKENPTLRRFLRVAGGILPYLSWLVPVVDRLVPRRDALTPGLRAFSDDLRNDLRNDLRSDLRTHLAAVQAAQTDLAPAIAEQQVRLQKLEEHAAELNHSLTNLSEDQLDLADQVRAMASWVRNASIAALFLLVLLFVLKLVQTVHIMGH
jgi:septal ring factor EnvC (AmiA/AmiB activator)